MSNRVAGPWHHPLRRIDTETGEVVAGVLEGPAGTFSTRTIARLGETSYGFASQHDAQRWADFELREAGYTLAPGPLDPPPLVSRTGDQHGGCLPAVVAIGTVAGAVGWQLWRLLAFVVVLGVLA